MSTEIDTRPPQQGAALAIKPGQIKWDEYQLAALAQIGLKDASNADRAVFLHQCQRTGLDPFSRQIYMIGRNEKVPGTKDQWRTKWTIQTGIDGWRVIRDRAERRAGVRGTLGREIWYDHEGNEFKVWVRRDAPAACEITYTVRDVNGETPYTSVLQFAEYVQTRNGEPIAQWATKGSHMLAKCTEADVYRKAFPQDFAGLVLDDAMPPAAPENMTGEELNAAYAKVTQGRVTAADIRGRTRPQARAEIMPDTPDASPAEPQSRAADTPPPGPSAGEAPDPTSRQAATSANHATSTNAQPATPAAADKPDGTPPAMATGGQIGYIESAFEKIGYDLTSPDDQEYLLVVAGELGGAGDITTLSQLTQDQAARVRKWLTKCTDTDQLRELLETGEVPSE